MKALCDPCRSLSGELDSIRRQFGVPAAFPSEVLAVAERNAHRAPEAHVDWTDRPFVTLDPALSTDLDQAFTIERTGPHLRLQYAIADIGWFVDEGDAVDLEAWKRGASLYLPDGKAPLYPPVLSQSAASLLPDGPRPAVVFSVLVDPDGAARIESVQRAIVRSRAKFAYETVGDEDLPEHFAELAGRIQFAEEARGAARVDPPQQEVVETEEGFHTLAFRPMRLAERQNAAMSLACNLAVAELLASHQTGLFRVMAEPDEGAIRRLKQTARVFDVEWPEGMELDTFERQLDPDDPGDAAMMLAIRRAGPPAAYRPWLEGEAPWHAAVAAPYAHATAPLRRLADRYVNAAALAIFEGRSIPESVSVAFTRLPKVMARADSLSGQIDRAVVELAEAVMLEPRIGQTFAAIVTDVDDRGARVQLRDFPVVDRVSARDVQPGDMLSLRLTMADPKSRSIRFEPLS